MEDTTELCLGEPSSEDSRDGVAKACPGCFAAFRASSVYG